MEETLLFVAEVLRGGERSPCAARFGPSHASANAAQACFCESQELSENLGIPVCSHGAGKM